MYIYNFTSFCFDKAQLTRNVQASKSKGEKKNSLLKEKNFSLLNYLTYRHLLLIIFFINIFKKKKKKNSLK